MNEKQMAILLCSFKWRELLTTAELNEEQTQHFVQDCIFLNITPYDVIEYIKQRYKIIEGESENEK